MTVVEFPKSKATARQEARRLAASKLRKDEGAAKSRAPRETMAERREAMSVLATALGLQDQSDPGPSAA